VSLRGRMQTTLDGDVPYFLMPSLGGGSTLRAYRSQRFRDLHSLLLQGEWRWFPNRLGMDVAIFYDAGKVAAERRDLDLQGMAHDVGVGVRLHTPAATPLRVEIAKGSDGWHVVWSGAHAF
jgi:hemolysin activation/secretion protein